MIKLFYAPGTCALATHIALEWIGEPYELQQAKLGDPEYLKINPLGQVPAIIDGNGEVMTQGDAILKYLARKYPAAKLGDDGTLQDGYDLDRWMAFLTGDLHPAFFPFYKPERYSTDSSVGVAYRR
jgi:glutathione S-transferase